MLKPFTPLAAANLVAVPTSANVGVGAKAKGAGTRSYSFSSTSTSSSVYSRAPEDLVDRLATHQVTSPLLPLPICGVLRLTSESQESTTFQLWSAGNVRIHKLDLTIPSVDAVELVEALRGDLRVGQASALLPLAVVGSSFTDGAPV